MESVRVLHQVSSDVPNQAGSNPTAREEYPKGWRTGKA